MGFHFLAPYSLRKKNMEQLPSNSHRQRQTPDAEPPQQKKVAPVITGTVVTRKQPFMRRISDTFLANRADTVGEFVVFDVLIPAAKNTFSDAVSYFVDKMLFENGRGRASNYRGVAGGVGQYAAASMAQQVAYNRAGNPMPGGMPPQPAISHRGRARHDFKEIVFPTRIEAEAVVDALLSRITEYNAVTVSDLYEMCNITPNYTDDKFGWTNIAGTGVIRAGGGFVIDLPRPEQLD